MRATGISLVPGFATGMIVYSDVPISFWGGVNTSTGVVIDRNHPLCGVNVKGTILAVPGGRGSSTGSAAVLELLLNECAPAALVFSRTEQILALGVWVARAMFDKAIPVLVLEGASFSALKHQLNATITPTAFLMGDQSLHFELLSLPEIDADNFQLSGRDQEILNGQMGEAARLSLQTIVLFARTQGADSLIDVTQAHIDACVYLGRSSLVFPQRLLEMGAKVAVPSTINALSVDMRRYQELGCDPEISRAASKIGEAYLEMGAVVSFTCAPYLLDTAPKADENVGWAESNAVVFANSVLGAKTQKYPDFLDVFIALTGRAPNAGCHTEQGRLPTICVSVQKTNHWDDSFFPLLGYRIGELVGAEIPFIIGVEHTNPRTTDLKAFGAAFATTSGAPMFHIRNITREALKVGKLRKNLREVSVSLQDLRDCWHKLNSNVDSSVSLISLGNPHFSSAEIEELSCLVKGREKHPKTSMVITTGRAMYEKSAQAGHVAVIESFGASFMTDTCWCMIGDPIIPSPGQNLMTNSGKYAHYAPGLVNRGAHFGSLRQCVEAAETGICVGKLPDWLVG